MGVASAPAVRGSEQCMCVYVFVCVCVLCVCVWCMCVCVCVCVWCFQNNLLDKSSHIADPMASAAGIPCAVDPLLYAAMKPHVGKGRG